MNRIFTPAASSMASLLHWNRSPSGPHTVRHLRCNRACAARLSCFLHPGLTICSVSAARHTPHNLHIQIPRMRSRQLQRRRCMMEMAYRERWQAEIAELQRILSRFDLREECKWGKPCYTMDGKNVVIIQGFKEYCALGFFQGA